jgi:hypothetical protein
VFKGTKEVRETVAAACVGDHSHGTVMGSWFCPPCLGPTGVKLTVSEWAGGCAEQLAEKILYGAEKFLEGRRCVAVSFPMDEAAGEPPLRDLYERRRCSARQLVVD